MAARPRVDLPAPDSPIRPSTSPRWSVRSMPLTISCHISSLSPSIRRPRICSRTSPFWPAVDACVMGLSLQAAGLVQEPVDDEINRHNDQSNGGGGYQRRDVAGHDEGGVFLDHRAPVRGRRLDAEAEERQRADGQEDEAEAQAELRH